MPLANLGELVPGEFAKMTPLTGVHNDMKVSQGPDSQAPSQPPRQPGEAAAPEILTWRRFGHHEGLGVDGGAAVVGSRGFCYPNSIFIRPEPEQ
jgi:hypothetical protein